MVIQKMILIIFALVKDGVLPYKMQEAIEVLRPSTNQSFSQTQVQEDKKNFLEKTHCS